MGILDDAIREHLELKRSHGASEDEIRRKEAEAFGPPQPEAPAAAPAESPHEQHTQLLTPDEHPAAADAELEPLEPAPEDPYAVHPGDDLVPDPDSPDRAEHDHDDAPAEAGAGTLEPSDIETGPPIAPVHNHDEQHPALIDHDHIGGEEHPPEPVFRREAPAPDTDEPPPRQSSEEDDEDEDEDVLEETPEFLQDAPEHDRLWFEQKPPRDFDFGE
jgi:hypothetical protein